MQFLLFYTREQMLSLRLWKNCPYLLLLIIALSNILWSSAGTKYRCYLLEDEMMNWHHIGISVTEYYILTILHKRASLEKSSKAIGFIVGVVSPVTWILKNSW